MRTLITYQDLVEGGPGTLENVRDAFVAKTGVFSVSNGVLESWHNLSVDCIVMEAKFLSSGWTG